MLPSSKRKILKPLLPKILTSKPRGQSGITGAHLDWYARDNTYIADVNTGMVLIRYKCNGLARSLPQVSKDDVLKISDATVCSGATIYNSGTRKREWAKARVNYFDEAKRRGLSCGVGEPTETTSSTPALSTTISSIKAESDFNPTTAARKRSEQGLVGYVPQGANIQKFDEATICAYATTGSPASWNPRQTIYIQEAKRRGLTCGVLVMPKGRNLSAS